MKKLVVTGFVFVFCLSLSVWALDKSTASNDTNAGSAPAAVVTLTDGGVHVSIDDFGRAGNSQGCLSIGTGFAVDEPNSVLCEHADYLSAGGAVKEVNAPNCTVVNPITADADNHATSTVQCGDCTLDFDQTVSDDAKAWTTVVTISGCTPSCYYGYTDYDVHGFMDNRAAWHDGEGGFLGQFVDQNAGIGSDVHYLFTDQSGAVHWTQGEWPSIRTMLSGLPACRDLPDGPNPFAGDFTAAIQYGFDALNPEGVYVVSYSHGRDDTTTIP